MMTLEEADVGVPVLHDHKLGRVIGPSNLHTNAVVVEFDNGFCGSYNVDVLSPFDAAAEQFNVLKDEVNSKLQEALQLLQEADALAKANNKSLTDKKSDPQKYDFDTATLIETINTIGLSEEDKLKAGK